MTIRLDYYGTFWLFRDSNVSWDSFGTFRNLLLAPKGYLPGNVQTFKPEIPQYNNNNNNNNSNNNNNNKLLLWEQLTSSERFCQSSELFST